MNIKNVKYILLPILIAGFAVLATCLSNRGLFIDSSYFIGQCLGQLMPILLSASLLALIFFRNKKYIDRFLIFGTIIGAVLVAAKTITFYNHNNLLEKHRGTIENTIIKSSHEILTVNIRSYLQTQLS